MDWHSSEKLVNFKYEERELQIKQKTVLAESRIKQDNDLELRGMVQELKSENEFLRQELERMRKEIERLQCEKTGEIYIKYMGVVRSSVCSQSYVVINFISSTRRNT